MKSFRSNLQAVRTLRQRQEQAALEMYAQALLGRQQGMKRLAAVEHELTQSWCEVRHHLTSSCAAAQLARLHAYTRSVEERRELSVRALDQAERHVNGTLQAMLSARRAREMVDSYLARQKRRYDADVLREERKDVDELAARRSGFNLVWHPAAEVAL